MSGSCAESACAAQILDVVPAGRGHVGHEQASLVAKIHKLPHDRAHLAARPLSSWRTLFLAAVKSDLMST